MIAATHLLDGLSDPRNPQTPKLMLAWTSTSPNKSKITGLKIPQSSGKRSPPWALSTTSWPQNYTHPTEKPGMYPTWSNWGYTSAIVPVNTPSAQDITGKSSSGPSWNSCSSSGNISSPQTPQLSSSNTLPRSPSPWTIRRMPFEVRPPISSDRSSP